MQALFLIFREMRHRKLNACLSVLAILAASALFTAFLTTADASKRETVRVMRDLGFNLRIIPRGTDMDQFWTVGYSDRTMPDDAVRRFAEYSRVFVSFNHLLAMLQQRFPVAGREVLLVGLAPTLTAPEQRDRPMGYSVASGKVIAGFRVAQRLALKRGSPLQLGGRTFTVEQCLAESGTDEDIRVYGSLKDVQQLLGLEGRINEIKAVDCLCLRADQDPLKILRAELEKALPEAQVVQLRTAADARAKQRQTATRYFGFMAPVVLLVCAACVGVLSILNVREREMEVGVLRALGHGSGRVVSLFLGRAACLGLAGALLGWWVGTELALAYGPTIFRVTAASLRADLSLLSWLLVLGPGFAAIASLIPAAWAVALDPAEILREA